MISQKHFKIIIIVFLSAVLLVSSFYLICRQTRNNQHRIDAVQKVEIMTEEEKNSLSLYHLGVYAIVSRDGAGKITAYKFVGLEDEKPISLDLMTAGEKAALKISPDEKVQVLKRNQSGQIMAYRFIKNDSDILTRY